MGQRSQERGFYWKVNEQNVKHITYFRRDTFRPFELFNR